MEGLHVGKTDKNETYNSQNSKLRRGKEKGTEVIREEKMAKNYQNWLKTLKRQIQES